MAWVPAVAGVRSLAQELPYATGAALKRKQKQGVPVMAQWLTNPTRNHEVAGSVPGLAQWVKRSGIAVTCGVGCRRGSDPTLLWLWCRPAATAPI